MKETKDRIIIWELEVLRKVRNIMGFVAVEQMTHVSHPYTVGMLSMMTVHNPLAQPQEVLFVPSLAELSETEREFAIRGFNPD